MEGEKKTMRASERHDWLHFCRDDFGAVMDFRKRKKEGRKGWGQIEASRSDGGGSDAYFRI